MSKRKVMDILQAASAELGATISQSSDGCITIEYDVMEYFLDYDEETRSFCLSYFVSGLKGSLMEKEFNLVLDVVKDFYPNCSGDWNEGDSYVSSPWYRVIVDRKAINGELLGKIIEHFFEAWSFACVNACLITDETVCGGVE